MTTFDYTNMAATATRLLTRFGTTLQLRRTTPGTYDPVTGKETGATTANLACIGLFTNISTSYAMANEV
ncbi:hypothetical protein [Rhodanobacter lindaniclasticus]|uniref:Uncharacterized protein n=1 Tax=Rhodanobacter lindaniclasticus TaxID=75310 RepID=A0A4S3KCL6_9GAMM|nr:hypothetical protein [Rhodanobacter lindaniclasticus]THD06109.1 hypothetical protein B1991_14280 [Rhodanobacter lindaniclasticus]